MRYRLQLLNAITEHSIRHGWRSNLCRHKRQNESHGANSRMRTTAIVQIDFLMQYPAQPPNANHGATFRFRWMSNYCIDKHPIESHGADSRTRGFKRTSTTYEWLPSYCIDKHPIESHGADSRTRALLQIDVLYNVAHSPKSDSREHDLRMNGCPTTASTNDLYKD